MNERLDERDDEPSADLPDELRALGRGLRIPPVDSETVVERVLSQLLRERALARARARGDAPAETGSEEPPSPDGR